MALTASWDKTAKLWDVVSSECLKTFEGHRAAVSSAAFLQDGDRILAAYWGKTARLWDVESCECLETLKVPAVPFCPLHFCKKVRILTASWDKAPKLWDVEPGECLQTFEGQGVAVLSAAFCKMVLGFPRLLRTRRRNSRMLSPVSA